MGPIIATVITALLVVAYLVAVLSVLSALLFLLGLWRFIRYEKQLAKNWNWLRDHADSKAVARPAPRVPRQKRRATMEPLDAHRVRRT